MPDTIKVQGEGGAIQTIDVPPEGSAAWERLEQFIERRWLVVVEGEFPPSTEPTDESESDGPPPKAGRGSGRDVWLAYAVKATGTDEAAFSDLSRDEIVEWLEAEGIPTEA